MKELIRYFPQELTLVFGQSVWNAYHTFFIPNDKAFEKLPNPRDVNRDVLLGHVTSPGIVLFTESWLYDFGIHQYPSLRIDSGGFLAENFKLKLSIRNVTDRHTGRWSLWAVSEVYERYAAFRRGAVWAKIVVPNIPVMNGVVHVIDSILGLVTETMEQLLNEDNDKRFTSLISYINQIGEVVRGYLSTSQAGLLTFFAPLNEAFDRIPSFIEQRLLRDKLWLTQIMLMHFAPGIELTSDEINNLTRINTIGTGNERQLFFIKGEWPRNNITYYVIGGGVKATIRQEDVSATNGIVHYIDRVLGVPYQHMFDIIKNETDLQESYFGLRETTLRYDLSPWEVVRPEQNLTFFVPTNRAWQAVPSRLRYRFHDGRHWDALRFVFKRHMIQGVALMQADFRDRSYVMMNNQRVIIRRTGRWWDLYWPYGDMIARIEEGGEIAATNGFMHKIDNVLVLEEDLNAQAMHLTPYFVAVFISCTLSLVVL